MAIGVGYFGLGRQRSVGDIMKRAKEAKAQAEAQKAEQIKKQNEEKASNPILSTEQPPKRGSGGLLSLKTDIKEEKETQLGKNRKFAQVDGTVGYVTLG